MWGRSGGESEGMGPLRRQRRRWDYNIKMDTSEILCGRSCVNPAQDTEKLGAVVTTVMKLGGPYNV